MLRERTTESFAEVAFEPSTGRWIESGHSEMGGGL